MPRYWDDDSFPVYGNIALPKKPTRDQLIDVQMHFQGLQINSTEFGNNFPVFEIFTPSFLLEDQQSIFIEKMNLKDTHAHVALACKYPGYGPNGIDLTKSLNVFRATILDRIKRGFYPLVTLAADGQTFNPDGWTYGYQYVYDNMYSIVGSYSDLLDYTATMAGFELLGPGGNWTPQQIDSFYIKLRQVFASYGKPNAVTALELGSGYDKWYEDGVYSWSQPGGQAVDIFLLELPQPVSQNLDGCEQLATSSLGPQAKNITNPNNVRPWYQVTGTPRGPRGNCAWEFALNAQVNDGYTPTQIDSDRNILKNYGWTSTG